jgi:hypothetical protein
MFNKIITENETIQKIQELYLKEFSNVDFNKIIKKEYYRQELVYIDNDFKYEGKLHNYTEDNFKLFYLTGCIDSYLMLEWCNQSNDKVGEYYIEALYFSRLIEGRSNRKHNRQYFKFNQTRARKIKDTLLRAFPKIIFKVPANYIGENVFITSFNPELDKNTTVYSEQIMKTCQEFNKEDLSFLNVQLELENNKNVSLLGMSFLLKEKFSNLKIIGDEYQQKLWQRENLFMFGVHWCFGANIIILSDNYLEISDSDWLKNIKRLINSGNQFVLGYGNYQESFDEKLITVNQIKDPLEICNDVFLWAAKYEEWTKLETITKMSWGKDTNELFFYQLTGQLPISADALMLDDVASKLFIEEKIVTNVNSLVSVKNIKEENDKYKIVETLSKAILNKVEVTALGLLETKSNNNALFDYLYYRDSFHSLDLFGKMSVLMKYNEKYGYTYNNKSSAFIFKENEIQKIIIDPVCSYVIENNFREKELYILPFSFTGSEHEVEIDLSWHFALPAEVGVYYLCFEVHEVSLEDLTIETQPKKLYLHGSNVPQSRQGQIIKIATLLDSDDFVNLKIKIKMKSIFKKNIKLKSVEKVKYDYNRGYLVSPPYKRDVDFIHFKKINGSEYLFTLKFSKAVDGGFYFTSGTEIIWPINYTGYSDIHYIYIKKMYHIDDIVLRNSNDNFDELIELDTKVLTLEFLERYEDSCYTLVPTESYINCDYVVDVFKKYKLTKEYSPGYYHLSLEFDCELSMIDPALSYSISPNGVQQYGVQGTIPFETKRMYFTVFLDQNCEYIDINLKFDIVWTRKIKVNFLEPIPYESFDTKKGFDINIASTVLKNEILIQHLFGEKFLFILTFKKKVECNFYFTSSGNIVWPMKYFGCSNIHYVYLDKHADLLNLEIRTSIGDLSELENISCRHLELDFDKTVANNFIIIKPNVNFINIDYVFKSTSKFFLNKKYSAGWYSIPIEFIGEFDLTDPELTYSVAPSGVREFGTEGLRPFSSNIRYFTVFLDQNCEYIYIDLSFKIVWTRYIRINILEPEPEPELNELFDDSMGFDVNVDYESSDNKVTLNNLFGEMFLFTLTFRDEVDGEYFFTASDNVIRPMKYFGNSKIHYLYLNKKTSLSKINIETKIGDFSSLENMTCRHLELKYIESLTEKSYKITPNVEYVNTNYIIDIFFDYKIKKKLFPKLYLLPIKLMGEFPIEDSALGIKVLPNGVLDNGVEYESKIYSDTLYLPVYLSADTSSIQIQLNYLMLWTRELEFIFDEPIEMISNKDEDYIFYRKYHSFSNDHVNLGQLSAGDYKVNLSFKTDVNCHLGLREKNRVIWPSKYTGKGTEHEYEFSNNFTNCDLILIDNNNNFSTLREITISKKTQSSLTHWKGHENVESFYLKHIGSQKINFKTILVERNLSQKIIENFVLPLDHQLVPGNYSITYNISVPEGSTVDKIQLYHGDFAKLTPHYLHDYYYENTITLALSVTEIQKTLCIDFTCIVYPFKELSLKIVSIDAITNEDSFNFFSKINTLENNLISLGTIYPSFYKVILFFTDKVKGEIKLECDNKAVWHPIYTGLSDIHVFFFTAQKELPNVNVHLIGIDNKSLKEVHILKIRDTY